MPFPKRAKSHGAQMPDELTTPVEGRQWNGAKDRWELDGVPYTYRVTWRSSDEAGREYSKEFTILDHGWDFKEDMENSASAYGVTWEHVPPV